MTNIKLHSAHCRWVPITQPRVRYIHTTACNSAYVSTETLNFTFARQAFIVYFYIYSNHRHIPEEQ